VACVAIGSAAVTAALGARYAGSSSGPPVPRLGGYGWFVEAVVAIGSPVVVTALTALLVVGLAWLRWPRAAVLAALSAPVASALTELVLKPLVDRTRGGSLAYPSGHTTGIFAVATVVVVLVSAVPAGRLRTRTRVWVGGVALAVAVAVASASVVVGDHYATDTVGGACVAVATVLGLGVAVDAVADRRR
jgi:undecaprenyl-diphosphatase